MFCANCGKEIPDGAWFCPYCGEKAGNSVTEVSNIARSVSHNDTWKKINNICSAFVPNGISVAFPMVAPVAIVGAYIVCFVVIITITISILGGKHDLEGTYYTYDFFPVSYLTFDKDGTFDSSEGEGKYSGHGKEYTLRYENWMLDTQYEIGVSKVDDYTLEVYIIPKGNYLAWLDTEVYFYKN